MANGISHTCCINVRYNFGPRFASLLLVNHDNCIVIVF